MFCCHESALLLAIFTGRQACHYPARHRMDAELKSEVNAASMASKSPEPVEILTKEEALRRFMARKAAREAAAQPAVTETPEQLAAKQETLNQLIAKQGLKRNAALERFIARKGLKLEGSSPS